MNNKRVPDNRTEQPLTDAERTAMKREFSAFMDMHAVPESTFSAPGKSWIGPFGRMASIGYAFSLLITLSAGALLYASESSLPEESLYVVKRNVTEKALERSTALFDSAEAWTDSLLIDRRLTEAETLLERDALKPELSDMLLTEISEHTGSLNEYIEEQKRERDYGEALDVGRDLENTFDAHAKLLKQLAHLEDKKSQGLIERLQDKGDEISALSDSLTKELMQDNEARTSYVEDIKEYASTSVSELDNSVKTFDLSEADPLAREIIALQEEALELYASSSVAFSGGHVFEAVTGLHAAIENVEQGLILMERLHEIQTEDIR